MTDLQHFIDTLPAKVTREDLTLAIRNRNIPLSIDDAINAWCQHDALHYISGHSFSPYGEQCIVYLEEVFQRGWLPLGENYNQTSPRPCKYDTITTELIDETAEMIKELIY